DRELLVVRRRVVVVQSGMHDRVIGGEVKCMRIPVEDPLHRDLRENAREVLDVELCFLRAADRVEGLSAARAGRAETDASERLLDLARTRAGATRSEVGRLADLAGIASTVARPGAEGRVVNVVRRTGVVVEQEVVALRVLPELLTGEAEELPTRVLELLGNLARNVVVGREADLVFAVRRQRPGRHDEVGPGARSRRGAGLGRAG